MNKVQIYKKIFKILPSKLFYWIAIYMLAEVTTNEYSDTIVSELTFMDALDRWGKLHNIK